MKVVNYQCFQIVQVQETPKKYKIVMGKYAITDKEFNAVRDAQAWLYKNTYNVVLAMIGIMREVEKEYLKMQTNEENTNNSNN